MIIVLKRALYQKEFGNAQNKAANTLALIQPKIQEQQNAITSNNSFGGFFTGQNRKNKKAAEQLGQQLSTIKSGGAGSEADRAARIANKNWTTADVQANMIHDARAERNAGTKAITLPRATTNTNNQTINNDQIVRGSSNIKGQYADESKKVAVRSMQDSLANKGTAQERLARMSPEERAKLKARVDAKKAAAGATGTNPTSTGTNPTSGTNPTGANPTSGTNPTGTNPTSGTNPTGANPTSGTNPTGTNPTSGTNPTGANPTSGTNPTGTNPTSGAAGATGTTGGSILSGLKTDAKNIGASAKSTWGNMSKGGKAAVIGGGALLAAGATAMAVNSIRNKQKAKEAEERARDAERRAARMSRRGGY